MGGVGLDVKATDLFLWPILRFTCHSTSFPSFSVLMDLSKKFTTRFACTEMAIYLDLCDGSGFVESYLDSKPTARPAEIAFEVLREWKKNEPKACGSILHRVLKYDLKYGEMADDFAQQLLS